MEPLKDLVIRDNSYTSIKFNSKFIYIYTHTYTYIYILYNTYIYIWIESLLKSPKKTKTTVSWLQHHSHQIYDLGLLVVLTLHQVNFEIIHYISQILNGFWWLNVKLSSNSKAFLTDLCWTCWISIAYSQNSVVCAGSTHVSCPGENSHRLSSPSMHLWLAVKKK